MCPEIGSEKGYSSEAERRCKIGTFLKRQRLTHSRHVIHRGWCGTWEAQYCYVEPRKSASHASHVSHESGFLFCFWFCLGTTRTALRQQLSLVCRTVARPTVQGNLSLVCAKKLREWHREGPWDASSVAWNIVLWCCVCSEATVRESMVQRRCWTACKHTHTFANTLDGRILLGHPVVFSWLRQFLDFDQCAEASIAALRLVARWNQLCASFQELITSAACRNNVWHRVGKAHIWLNGV